jgi:hypothetical protein
MIVRQNDPATYWLTQILQENASKLNDLPDVITRQEFSHVKFMTTVGSVRSVVNRAPEQKRAARIKAVGD